MQIEIEGKKRELGAIEIMSRSLKYFFLEIPNAKIYFVTIITLILASKTAQTYTIMTRFKIDSTHGRDVIWVAFFKTMVVELGEVFSSHLYNYLIDVVFIKNQTNISVKAFKSIVSMENSDMDMSSGRLQYFVNTGSRAMSKLMTTLIFYLVAEVVKMTTTFWFIGEKIDGFSLRLVFVFSIMMLFMHVKVTEIKVMYKKKSNISLADCDKALYETLLNMDVIKSNAMEMHEVNKYYEKVKVYRRFFILYGQVEDVLELVQYLLYIGTRAALFLHLYHTQPQKDLAPLTRSIETVLHHANMSIGTTGSQYRKIQEAIVNSKLVLEYIREARYTQTVRRHLEGFFNKFEFKKVDIFAKEKRILHNLNFEILKGEKVGLVGRNGIGKSTIFKTILALQRYEGSILVDGVLIDTLDLPSYRSIFAYVPQDNFLFDDTIYYNLVYGCANVSQAKIDEIVKKINLYDSIMTLDNGYNFKVGEKGGSLSGGMRQKVIIARAFLRNSEIFLFDEPQNNLDKASGEELVNLVFGEAFADKTIIMISHNYDILDRFDKVVCIDENAQVRTVSMA